MIKKYSKEEDCLACSNTGILNANLVKNEDGSNKEVVVALCVNHHDNAQKNIRIMEKLGLSVKVN